MRCDVIQIPVGKLGTVTLKAFCPDADPVTQAHRIVPKVQGWLDLAIRFMKEETVLQR